MSHRAAIARRLMLAATVGAWLGGCRHDPRPVYQEPALDKWWETVTLKGDGGWLIDGVDGNRIDRGGLRIAVLNAGNSVTATPGVHHVRAVYEDANGNRASALFAYKFAGGHTYAFIPIDAFDRGLKVVDDNLPGSPPLHNAEDDNDAK